MSNFWKQLRSNNKPFYALAPMDGVTDHPFRELLSEIGKPDVLFTEFTNVDALMSKGYDRNINRLKYSEKQRYIVAQIWGNNPENYLKTANLIKELRFDGVDINMGCPDKTVMKLGSGAGLISNPTLAKEVFLATRQGAQEIAVSIKTRIGIDKVVTNEWIPFLLQLKPDALTVHARTADELSKVSVHEEEYETIVKIRDSISPDTIIIANGDINTIQQGNDLYENYKLDGLMVGRGIFVNPWLFEKSEKVHSSNDRLNLLLHHAELYNQMYSNPRMYHALKKYFSIYVRAFKNSSNLKDALMHTKNYNELTKIISDFLSLTKLA